MAPDLSWLDSLPHYRREPLLRLAEYLLEHTPVGLDTIDGTKYGNLIHLLLRHELIDVREKHWRTPDAYVIDFAPGGEGMAQCEALEQAIARLNRWHDGCFDPVSKTETDTWIEDDSASQKVATPTWQVGVAETRLEALRANHPDYTHWWSAVDFARLINLDDSSVKKSKFWKETVMPARQKECRARRHMHDYGELT